MKRPLKYTILFIICIAISLSATASIQSEKIRSWDIEEGLSDSIIYKFDEEIFIRTVNDVSNYNIFNLNLYTEESTNLAVSRIVLGPSIYEYSNQIRIYYIDYDNTLYCIDGEDMSTKWTTNLSNTTQVNPVENNGKVYLTFLYGQIICLDSEDGSFVWKKITDTGKLFKQEPVFFGDNLYIGEASESGGNLYCFQADTGVQKWKYYTEGNILFNINVNGESLRFRSSETYYSLEPETGSLLWKYNTDDLIEPGPYYYNGKVFIGAGSKLICLNENEMRKEWELELDSTLETLPVAKSNMLVALSSDMTLYGINIDSGTALWKMSEDYLSHRPVIRDKRVFVATENSVESINLMTGKKIWSFDGLSLYSDEYNQNKANILLEESFTNESIFHLYFATRDNIYWLDATEPSLHMSVWSFDSKKPVYSSVSYWNGLIYYGGRSGKLYCLDAAGGTKYWNYLTTGEINASPLITNNRIYIGSGNGEFYCLGANLGNEKWYYSTEGPIVSTACADGDYIYFGSGDSNIYSLRAYNGEEIWIYETDGEVYSSPVISGDSLYIGSYDGYLRSIDKKSGTLNWEYDLEGRIFSSPLVVSNRVYIGTESNLFYCLSTNGNPLWAYRTEGPIYSTAVADEGRLYFGGYDGYFYCINATNGSLLWKYDTMGIIQASALLVGDRVYVGSGSGYLYGLKKTTGELDWKYYNGFEIYSSPVMVNGRIYFGDFQGYMNCIDIFKRDLSGNNFFSSIN